MADVFAKKRARLARGEPPRVLDLFSGCGGISLGFQRAGFRIDAAIEFDKLAAQSHALNFHGGDARHGVARDITKIEPEDLCRELDLGPADQAFDIVVGGPPCQAYARVGRAKLREVAEHPEAFKVDARANLYLRYLHYVAHTKPLALLMENVHDIMNFGGHNIAEEIAEALEGMGYVVGYTLANAAYFGVPQLRDRVFLIAYRRELGLKVSFPKPTRWVDMPSGYSGTRAVAFKHIDLFSGSRFIPEAIGSRELPYAVTASEAIGDLAPVTLHLEGLLKRGARRFTEVAPYPRRKSISEYAQMMRSWPGFEGDKGPKDHVIRYLPRDTDIFRKMNHGDEYPAANALAVRLFEEEAARIERKTKKKLTKAARETLRRKMVPPYPTHNFPNRWWKLRPDQPSRTLLAHIGKDTYSHIHYDGKQARTISVREAARLQSFPDGFVFCGTMNPAFRQIGNAVPPVMAWAIGQTMAAALKQAAIEAKPKPHARTRTAPARRKAA
jgi:DNA (cytosine-5)-methyltransferase 1